MRQLILLALVGFAAQLVDGSLGMGYGVTSTSLLLIVGLSPALASASVHLAELGTNVVSGVSHWRLGNVDWRLVRRLGLPGAVGALGGATVLSQVSSHLTKPVMAVLLGALGLYIVLRYLLRPPATSDARRSPHTARFLIPLGLVGGFVDATGGGGWGPISTSTLLGAGKTAPRTVIGSVDTSEFLVSFAASVGFVVNLGLLGIRWEIVAVLLLGGVLAAPLAAWLVSVLPARIMGVAVGGLVVLTNLRTLLELAGASGVAVPIAYGGVVAGWVAVVAVTTVGHRRERATAAPRAEEVPA